MSRLIRTAYGRSGQRLDRILVSVPGANEDDSRRYMYIMLAVLLLVPALVSQITFSTKNTSQTVVDTSHLPIEQPRLCNVATPPPPEIAKAQPTEPPPPEKTAPPVEKPLPSPPALAPTEPPRPVIARAARPVEDTPAPQPRVARTRTQAVEQDYAPQTRIMRSNARQETAGPAVAISRMRSVAAVEVPVANERLATVRRGTASTADFGANQPQMRVTRQRGRADAEPAATASVAVAAVRRSAAPSGEVAAANTVIQRSRGGASYQVADAGTPRVVAARGRSRASGGDGETGGTGLGLSHVSLASLGICSSPQEEEDHIKAVLRKLGDRQICSSSKGEYLFKGTQRISSFNLIITPAKGRRPTNRCEELDYAYRCLTEG